MANVAGLPLPLGREEAKSSSMATLAPLAPPAGGPHVLDDGPKADTWLELIKWRSTFDELVTFFYDSFTVMACHAGEFFSL